MKRECETCIKRKTPYCPTSIDCMATDDMPYYQNRIMLLEENQELKKQLEEYKDNYNCLLKQKEQFEYIMSKQVDYLGQKKEFIKYLEDEIDICDSFLDTVKSDLQEIPYGTISVNKTYITTQIKENEIAHKVYEEILQKYKSIIGVSDDKIN